MLTFDGVERGGGSDVGGGLVNSGIDLFDELLPSFPVAFVVEPSELLGLIR